MYDLCDSSRIRVVTADGWEPIEIWRQDICNNSDDKNPVDVYGNA